MFVVIVELLLIWDALWWLWADRVARQMRHPKVWRPLVGLWSGLLLGYLAWFIAFPTEGRHAHAWMPIWALAVIYLWHLIVLPGLVVCMLFGKIVGGARSLWRKFIARDKAAQTAIRGLSD